MSLVDPQFTDTLTEPKADPATRAVGPFKARAEATAFPTRPDAAEMPRAPGFYRAGPKRIFDTALVILAAPLWLPLVAIFAALVALDGHNPFYTQPRIGRGARVFRMIKLRSMVPGAEAKLEAYLADNAEARAEWNATQKLKHDPRITRLGRLIRKTSIDELPQLINVLKGDMSIVGPRPFMVDQKALYPGTRYYDMRPGLTGFWQVSDRNECDFADRVKFDDDYHKALSLKTDLSVMVRTFGVILKGTGY